MVSVDDAALAMYQGAENDCLMFYACLDRARAREAVLFALEWRGLKPPLHVLEMLWQTEGLRNPYPFFVPAVFDEVDLWEGILRDLVAHKMWDALSSYRATHARAVFGHLICSSLYLQALDDAPEIGLRLCTCYVSPSAIAPRHMHRLAALLPHHTAAVLGWLERLPGGHLAHIADTLIRLPGVDNLLEKMVLHPMFRAAVARRRGASLVCLLAVPLAELTDEELRVMVTTYLGARARLSLGRCYAWHTEQLRRGMATGGQTYGPPVVPQTVHELLYWVSFYYELPPHDPYLLAKTVREQPVASSRLPVDLVSAVKRDACRMAQDVQLAGRWSLPKELMRHVASFVG